MLNLSWPNVSTTFGKLESSIIYSMFCTKLKLLILLLFNMKGIKTALLKRSYLRCVTAMEHYPWVETFGDVKHQEMGQS